MLLAAAICGVAAAQTPVEEANALYNDIRPERRSETVLLPGLLDIEPPPPVVRDLLRAKLLSPGISGWAEAEGWATSDGSVRALEALSAATPYRDVTQGFGFAQPYGVDGVPVELLVAGMYTELGDPPLLAAAQFGYLERLTWLRHLAHVEASRLVGEDEPFAAMQLMVHLAALGYQIMDREMVREAVWGMDVTIEALRRIRDIAYADFRGRRLIDRDGFLSVIGWLDRDDGMIVVDRLNYPRADAIASRQLIAEVYTERGGVQRDKFVVTFTRLLGGDRPLLRFGASSRVQRKVLEQQDWFDITDTLKEVEFDYQSRWDLPTHDSRRQLTYEYDLIPQESTLAVLEPLRLESERGRGHGGDLLDGLTVVEVERVGTRLALAHVGRSYREPTFAPTLTAVRPAWLRNTEDDLFNPNRRRGVDPPDMLYFRPVTDYVLRNRRDRPQPHELDVFPADGSNFSAVLTDDTFLLYSVGPDGSDDRAVRVAQDPTARLGDYMIWPPVLSLQREHLMQIGELR